MKQNHSLIVTGLGNEVDLKTGKSIFTVIFNDALRVVVSEEVAKQLTAFLYASKEEQEDEEAYSDVEEPLRELADTQDTVYDQDTGVEQV